jgi:polyisoprenoid-binding protein YceI
MLASSKIRPIIGKKALNSQALSRVSPLTPFQPKEDSMVRKIAVLALGLGLSLSLSAADTYNFGGKDAAHSEIGFKITHWMVNKVHGSFDKFEGQISYDEKNVEKSKVDVTIDTASINTRNDMRDKHLKSPDFFDVEKFPQATFKSSKVEKAKDGKGLDVSGDLTLHGITKPVVLKVTIPGKIEDNYGNTRLGFEATTTLKRTDFGIAWNKTNKTGTTMLGDDVEIDITGEAVQKK